MLFSSLFVVTAWAVSSQESGCCYNMGFGSMMKPCCQNPHGNMLGATDGMISRSECPVGKRAGGATEFVPGMSCEEFENAGWTVLSVEEKSVTPSLVQQIGSQISSLWLWLSSMIRGLTTPQQGLPSCLNAESIVAGGTCMDKYFDIKHILRPTQGVVGWAYVMHEVEKLSSKELAQEWYDKNHIPVVVAAADNDLGYVLYVVDHHHHTSGLDYTGYNIDYTIEILCDLRKLSQDEFWARMTADSLVYLGVRNPDAPLELPELMSPLELPKSFNFKPEGSDFIDDTFRSLAGFSKKLKDKDFCAKHGMNNDGCNRCFEMICNEQGGGIPFYEFRWGYFFSDALSNPSLWRNDTAYKIFNQAFSKFEYPAFPLNTNVDEWTALVRLLIPLCRSSAAIDYELRSDMFPRMHGRPSLPGYYPGLIPEDDPECSAKDMNCNAKGPEGRSELELLSFMAGVGGMQIFWFGLIAVTAGFVFYVLRRRAKTDETYDLVI